MARVESTEANSRPPVEIEIAEAPAVDEPTVTPAGERLDRFIDGVQVRPAITHSDERGSLTEMYDPAWGFMEEPLVYVYEARIHPGQKKAWIVHREQDDRLFFAIGSAKIVLYDARPGSPTQGLLQEVFLGNANRGLLRIPAGVFHAVVNVGPEQLVYINMPTKPYRHERPDKERLPLDTTSIPYEL